MMSDRNYYRDHRVNARQAGEDSPILKILADRKLALVRVPFDDEDGNGFEDMELPIVFEVCPTCGGSGTHVNPSVDCDGLSAEDFAEDPEFAENYFGGCYDVACYECDGERVIPVLDRSRIDPAIMKRLDEKAKDDAEYRSLENFERRMGC